MEAVIRLLSASFIVLLAAVMMAAGQSSDDRDRLRMAATYERAGDNRGAARIYQELYAQYPSNESFFQGVVRTLSALQQFDALMPLVESHATTTRTESACILAGTLRARRGERDLAIRWWDAAIDASNDKEQAYVAVSNEQRKVGLYDAALVSLRKAIVRSQREEQHPYSDEVVALLTLTGAYDEACDEILAVFALDRDVYRTMRSLTLLLASDAAAAPVAKRVARLASDQEESVRLKQWVYRQLRQWELALDETMTLDRLVRARGNELLMFADGARNDEQYGIALQAYEQVLRLAADQRTSIAAAYGSVRTLEQQLRRQRDLSPQDAREIVKRYDDVIASYPNHPLCADALLNAARIEDAILGNSESARSRLQRIQLQWRGTTVYGEASLLLATLYLSIGNDSEARVILEQLIAAPDIVVSDRKDIARLMLADMQLWQGKINTARELYSSLADQHTSAAANDAIDRMLLIDLAQDDSASVLAFASAEGQFVRRSYTVAYPQFMALGSTARDPELRERALMRAAEVALMMHDDSLALMPLRTIAERIPETIWGDRVLMRLSEIEERRGDVAAAMQALNALLVAYPRSIFVPAARDRIRKLRGDS